MDSCFNLSIVHFRDCEKFNFVSELLAEIDIKRTDGCDAFGENIIHIHVRAEREVYKDCEFVRGVNAAHVKGRVCFGIAGTLRFRQNIFE